MRLERLAGLVCLTICGIASASDASRLAKRARLAEKTGNFAEAWVLYSQAAVLSPNNTAYWLRSQAVKSRGAQQAKVTAPAATAQVEFPPELRGPSLLTTVSDNELNEARRPLVPRELRGDPVVREFHVRGDAKALFTLIAKDYKLDCVFDGDFQAGQPVWFHLDQADFRGALRALEALTGSFLVPLSDKLFLVAKDTQQKRTELEPTMAIAVEIPEPVTIQEAQELARTVQQAMDIRRFGIDSVRRIALLNDRVSKVRPAEALFRELLGFRPELALELKFVEVDRSLTRRFGLDLPNTFNLISYAAHKGVPQKLLDAGGRLVTLGGGVTAFAFAVADAKMIAQLDDSQSRLLLHANLRATDLAASQIHIGERYPILTGGYYGGADSNNPNAYRPPPQVTFEDLGLSVKMTPKAHGSEEVTLQVEAEFKVLGAGGFNGIPTIVQRRLQSVVRVRNGEWAVIAGMMTQSEARAIAGLYGLAQLPGLGPLFRTETTTRDDRDILILVRPYMNGLSPADRPARSIWVGPEGRLNIPL